MRMFYSKSVKLRNTLQGEPEQLMEVKPGKASLAEKYVRKSGHCLITTGMDTQGGILTAVYSDQPALGVAWCPVATSFEVEADARGLAKAKADWVAKAKKALDLREPKPNKNPPSELISAAQWDERCKVREEAREEAKALTVWFNSCFGWVALLSRRSGNKLTFPNWSHTQLREVILPKRDQCDFQPLLDAFHAHKDTPMLPVGRQAEDPVREAIDRAAAQSAGIDWTWTERLRRKIAAEPTVRKVRKVGV